MSLAHLLHRKIRHKSSVVDIVILMTEEPKKWTPKIVGGTEAPKNPLLRQGIGSKESPDADRANSDDITEGMLGRDVNYILTHKGRVSLLAPRAVEIIEFINSLEDFVEKKETIHMRMNSLSGMELEDIVAHMLDSNKLQWKVDPSFYLAVLRYGRIRMERVKDIVQKGKPSPEE